MTIRVSKFEFVKNTSKYLKGEEVIITHRGEDCLVLTPVGESISVKPEPKVNVATKKEKKEGNKSVLNQYNSFTCGCVKAEGKYLCPKHGRM